MREAVDDPIEVGVQFSQRGCRPVWMIWNGKRRMIQRVTYTWKAQDGLKWLRYFAVTDGEALYELCFDPTALRWRLTSVALETSGTP